MSTIVLAHGAFNEQDPDNGDRVHAAEHYLSASVTGEAVASGLAGG